MIPTTGCFMQLLFACLSLFIIGTAPLIEAMGAIEECSVDSGAIRLPRLVEPVHYNLFIRPNLDELTYEGRVSIQLNHKIGTNHASNRQQQERSRPTSKLVRQLKTLWRKINVLPEQEEQLCKRSKIMLHASTEVQINDVHLTWVNKQDDNKDDSSDIQVTSVCREPANDVLVISLNCDYWRQAATTTGSSQSVLELTFAGSINGGVHGLYRTEYDYAPEGSSTETDTGSSTGSDSGTDTGDDNTKRRPYIAVSDFETGYARTMFPCFDEPDFKATFDVTIEHASHLKALSNMHAISEERLPATIRKEGGGDNHYTRVTFARTPRMSTYLLAFAIGQFDHIEAIASDGMRIAIWTPPGRAGEAQFALKSAVRAYEALNAYFGIDQPLEKIDFVSVGKHCAGATENWGLITVTEELVLLDDTRIASNPSYLLDAIDTWTHELVHFWFGNLVTMRWWDDLWLNEGFASWLAQVHCEQLYPEYQFDLIYLADSLNDALKLDSDLTTTHPIRNTNKLQTIEELESSFDYITYFKASAVLRMLNEYMQPEVMQQSVIKYLRSHSYNNADSSNLWTSLEASSGLEVSDFMKSWIDQAGFPLIKVELASSSGRSTLIVSQERFETQIDGTNLESNELQPGQQQQTWIIPVSVLVSYGENSENVKTLNVLMSERQVSIELPELFDINKRNNWIKVNANYAGYYRVSYLSSKTLLKALKQPIESKLMKPIDRLNIYCDMFALFEAKQLQLEQLDQVLAWYKTEDNDVIVNAMAKDILKLNVLQQAVVVNWKDLLVSYYARKFQSSGGDTDNGGGGGGGPVRQITRQSLEKALKKLGHHHHQLKVSE